ncbi:MAG: hypothetical protein HY343_01425 [Lentisphaerae bacterium]|nr:hypothetical protein [Lentisphaerota bacterium]
MKRWTLRLSLGILLCGCTLAFSQPRRSVSLTCGVYEGKEINRGLTDLLTAKLSENRDVVVVDRTSLNMVLGEKSLTMMSEDVLRQARVGRLLGIDYFVWVNAATTSAVVEVVEASTGRGVAVWRVGFEKDHLINGFPALAAEATRRALTGLPPVTKRLPVIAFVEPFPASPSRGMAVNGDVES